MSEQGNSNGEVNVNSIELEFNSSINDEAIGTNQKMYRYDDDILFEVDVDDEAPPDDDETVWTEANDNLEDQFLDDFDNHSLQMYDELEAAIKEPAIDMALSTFEEHSPESVYCVSIHHKRPGVIISGGGDDKAYIWQYAAPDFVATKVHELGGHSDSVTTVGFNFDGTLALTGAYDGTIRVWSVDTGELQIILEGPEDIEWAEWHSKGNAIIAGSKDGTAWMWLAHSGQCLQVFAGHDGSVSSGCFSKDGKFVCTGGDDGTVRLWAPKTGACKHTFEDHFGHDGTVTALVSDTEADLLLSGSVDGTMKLFQISGKRVLHTFVHSLPTSGTSTNSRKLSNEDDMDNGDDDQEAAVILGVECVGFALGDFKWVASGGLDKTLKIWETVTGACRTVCEHGGSVVALKWHSKLPVISTAALDQIVRVWDARSGSLLVQLTGHNDLVTNLDMMSQAFLSPNSASGNGEEIIATVSDDGTSKIFHINCAELIANDKSSS